MNKEQDFVELAMKAIARTINSYLSSRYRLSSGGRRRRYPELSKHMNEYRQVKKAEKKCQPQHGTLSRRPDCLLKKNKFLTSFNVADWVIRRKKQESKVLSVEKRQSTKSEA